MTTQSTKTSIATAAKNGDKISPITLKTSRLISQHDDDEEASNDLTVTTGTTTTKTMEVFTCIAYCSDNQTLCAGTNQGNLYTWKRLTSAVANYTFDVPENAWQLNNVSSVRGAVKQCDWGICDIAQPCVMLNCIANVYILKVKIDSLSVFNISIVSGKFKIIFFFAFCRNNHY